jgi:anti-sigma B factor antagonist
MATAKPAPIAAAKPAPQRFEAKTTTTDAAIVVKCSGRLVSDFTQVLKEEVRPLLDRSTPVILDFTAVTHLDSSGLGTVVSLYVSAKTHGCKLGLVNLSPHVRELLGLTHLLSALETCGQYMVKLP